METASFSISQLSQEMHIDPLKISGSKDELNSFLNIPVSYVFNGLGRNSHFDVTRISAILLLNNTIISSSEKEVAISCNKEKGETIKDYDNFQFSLSEKEIHFIEKTRQTDICFDLKFKFSIINKTKYVFKDGVMHDIKLYDVDGLQIANSIIRVPIPHSIWISVILPNFNFKQIRLIELPITVDNMNEEQKKIFDEFQEAEKYFKLQDYNQCVGACRKVLEPLSIELKKYKENKSKSNNTWLNKVDASTLKWIDDIHKETSQITSKVHHRGTYEDFTRHEAESIYLVTLGLLNFVSHLQIKQQ